MINVLQNFFVNNLKNEKANPLYYKLRNGTEIKETRRFMIFKGGVFKTNTYFNAFPLNFFIKNTAVKHIGVHVKFTGNALFKIVLLKSNFKKIYFETIIHGNVDNIFWIDGISDQSDFDLMYTEFIALEDSEVDLVEWVTDEDPVRNIHLAICCTTFNRQDDIKKLYNRLSNKEYLTKKCKLIVVNNGDPIDVPNTDFCKVIKNKNTGGTGGFMRGLVEAYKTHEFTHVMFIDDDAFCEPLSILKAINILEYAKDINSSVAGAMLFLDRPWIQYEAGATLMSFNIKSNNPNLNLCDVESLLTNSQTSSCSYGPWWFFIFPIKDGLKMSFPFFVRGDDVTFSLRNNFSPFIVNGICSWQESFDAKISPSVEYLAFRSFVMISLLYLETKPSSTALFRKVFSHIIKEAAGYRYQIADALCQSLKDVMTGPDFWENHLEMGPYIKALTSKAGKMDSYSVTNAPIIPNEPLVSKKRKLFALFTIFGNLVPSVLCRSGKTVWGLGARPFVAVGRKGIYQYSPENKQVFVFRRNSLRFFKIFFKSLILTSKLVLKRESITTSYKNSLKRFESPEFWEEKLK